MSTPTRCPLYSNAADARNEGHAGLYYNKFFSKWSTNWSLKNTAEMNPKQEWIEEITGREIGKADVLNEYRRRIWQLVEGSRGGQIWVYRTEERLVTGTGRSHPVENGFIWHSTLGVPYLPGSSLKGLIGNRDREVVLGSPGQVGRVILLDATPIAPIRLETDVITPHYSPWSATNPPADWRVPIPIPFLTVAPGALFLFAVLPRGKRDSGDVVRVGRWIEEALTELGAGAKTAVGYGRMKLAIGADVHWLTALRSEAELARQAQVEAQRVAQMDPLDRELDEITKASRDPNIKPWHLWLKELERGRWSDPVQARSVAGRIRREMETDNIWRPVSNAKNPAKDHRYQSTLSVMKYLG